MKQQLFPLTLAAVSSRWRAVAVSTPQIWTNLALDNISTRTQLSAASLLRLYLQNVAHAGFMGFLNFKPHWKEVRCMTDLQVSRECIKMHENIVQTLEPIRAVLFSNYSRRITVLRMNAPPPCWLPQFPGKFVKLRELFLGWPVGYEAVPSTAISFPQIPQLQNVRIQYMKLSVAEATWSSLTRITLTAIPYDVCVHILTQSPNITLFHSLGALIPESQTRPDLTQSSTPLRLPHLTTFIWTCMSSASDAALLRRLKLPALVDLGLDGIEIVAADALQSFVSQLPSTIRVVALYPRFLPRFHVAIRDNLERTLRVIPHIKVLQLKNICPGLFRAIIHILTPTTGTLLCPDLDAITVWNSGEDRVICRTCTLRCDRLMREFYAERKNMGLSSVRIFFEVSDEPIYRMTGGLGQNVIFQKEGEQSNEFDGIKLPF